MPFKEGMIELGDARIYVWRFTEAGELVSFAVVLLALALIDREWGCITRYDCAHGFAHRDVIGRASGLLY
jgi:hypothetical protein